MRGQDYSSEIRPGARVMDGQSTTLGWVYAVEPRCHWGCGPDASQWRPRSAYVIRDERPIARKGYAVPTHGDGPMEWAPSYVAPEYLSAVPDWWTSASILQNAPRVRVGVFQPTVIRYREGAPKAERWWLMNRQAAGWGERGYGYPSIGAVLDAWSLRVESFDRDDVSLIVRVVPT